MSITSLPFLAHQMLHHLLELCTLGKLVEPSSSPKILKPATLDEVWGVVSSLGNDKAMGPDGFLAKLFKASWSIIGSDIVGMVQKFLTSEKMLKQMNHANITLIPKTLLASRVGEFRTISLCNITYKIIAKVLANCLLLILHGIIGKNQATFLSGRLMNENIFLFKRSLVNMQERQSHLGVC